MMMQKTVKNVITGELAIFGAGVYCGERADYSPAEIENNPEWIVLHQEIKTGAQFTFKRAIYEIAGDIMGPGHLIACVSIARPGASPLWKPNRTQYQYFSFEHIREFMAGGA